MDSFYLLSLRTCLNVATNNIRLPWRRVRVNFSLWTSLRDIEHFSNRWVLLLCPSKYVRTLMPRLSEFKCALMHQGLKYFATRKWNGKNYQVGPSISILLTRLTIFTTFRRQKPDHRPLVVVVVTLLLFKHHEAYQSVNKKLTKTYKTLVKLIKHVKQAGISNWGI